MDSLMHPGVCDPTPAPRWTGPYLVAVTPSQLEPLRVALPDATAWVAGWARAGAEEIARVGDPAAATDTVYWGRNYLYAANWHGEAGSFEVVVKQFRHQGRRRRLERRLRGSKATRSWRAAQALLAAGIPTPEPVALVEADDPAGVALYISRRVSGAVEIRDVFRALDEGTLAAEMPQVDPLEVLAAVGRLARRMHDAGLIFRDLSMGNVLLVPVEGGGTRLMLVDLNRVRAGRRPGFWRRTRELCRLPVVASELQAALLEGYLGRPSRRWSPRWLLLAESVRGYIAKHAVKRRLRSPIGRHRSVPGVYHAHIPRPAEGSAARDRAVWDRLSDQPHQHARPWQKLLVRAVDAPEHLRDLAVVAGAAPRVVRRLRELRRELYRDPVPFTGLGVGLRPYPADRPGQLAALDGLGVRHVLLRLHPWEDDHDEEERLAQALAERGYDVAFALPQNRELVRDRARWRAKVAELGQRFTPYGRTFQVGQGINRSKWGVWNRREYLELAADAAAVLRPLGVEVAGPGVIDFEYHHTVATVFRRHPGFHLDILSALLYVDRRGAPEHRQLGCDTIDKVLWLRAIADTAPSVAGRCWVTEVNWPLPEGPHAPAGRTVAVDEATAADYLARYFLLALTTGAVERVYWWQLIARGYGLVAPPAEPTGGLRRRPAWSALQNLARQLDGAVCTGPLELPAPARGYRFERGGEVTVAAWSCGALTRVRVPGRVLHAVRRDGQPFQVARDEVELGSSPVYMRMDEAPTTSTSREPT